MRNAGERASRVQKSTLLRAIHEACRTTFSTDSNKKGIRYTRLDTDFVLGTCIQYLIENGIDCHWKHISDKPKEEKAFAQEHNPVIQNESAKIYSEMKIKMSNRYWDITKAANRPATELDRVYGEAKDKVSQEFLQKLKKRGVHI